MKLKFVGCVILVLLGALSLTAQTNFRKDFDYFWTAVKNNYCYWDKKATDWEKVRGIYGAVFDSITSKKTFVLKMELVINELYDHHISLSTNTTESQRLVPSGTDIWAEYSGNKAVIKEVRLGFGAYRCGLKAGMEIISFNDIPVEKAIEKYFPLSLLRNDTEAKNYALRELLAGLSTDDRKITVRDGPDVKIFYPDRPDHLLKTHSYPSLIESKLLAGNIGYIRINNRLWDNNIIVLFDSVLQRLKNTRSLILDLRETPSGGNTTVARAILGSFIRKEGFYQKHELTVEEREYGIKRSWLELVTPRRYVYTKPLVVLVNHWTGSVGEGITIGFDAFKRVTIIGTRMARLNGAIYSYEMPFSKIGFSIPVEKLFHVNGIAREKYEPAISVDLTSQQRGQDAILSRAVSFLLRKGGE